MRALVYHVTKHTIPGWIPFHEKERRGIAYEADNHFVHFFGKDDGLWIVSPGLTVTQKKSGSLQDWIVRTFGAVNIEQSNCDVGHTVAGVWRPGLYHRDEILQALDTTAVELRLAEQALLLLIQRLDELLHFVEPTTVTLNTYSHKSRELLILSCTEIENSWKAYMRIAGCAVQSKNDFTTNDYIKLKSALHLDEFQISLPRYSDISPIRPFRDWSTSQPTKSLNWYDAYNKTKHDRNSCFSEATLWNCLQALAANLTMFSVRFGPFQLFHGAGSLSAFVNQLFTIEIKDCKAASFYCPKLRLTPAQREDLICFDSTEFIEPRNIDLLKLQ